MKDKKIQEYLKNADRFSDAGELYQGISNQDKGTRDLNDRWKLYRITSKDLKDAVVVDIGCNIGGFSFFCKDDCKSYLGIDTYKKSIELARHLFPFSNCTFEVGKFRDLYGRFDVILALAVRRYTGFSFEEFAKECHSLLNKNGLMFFESHGREKWTPTVRQAFEKYFDIQRMIYVPSTSHSDCENVRFFIRGKKK